MYPGKKEGTIHEKKTFLQAVAERYGNPRATWLRGHLRPGQKIRFVLDSQNRIVDGVAVGRRRNGKHLIRYYDGSRKWVLSVNTERILVDW